MLRSLALAICAVASGVSATTAIPFLPPGVGSALQGARLRHEDLTLALHPPEEDQKVVNDSLDSLLKIEQLVGKASERDFIAQKQRLLNAEVGQIHAMVAGAGKTSFLLKARPFDSPDVYGDILAHS